MRQSFVSYAGPKDDGGHLFDLGLSWPEQPSDVSHFPPTERQLAAIEKFYGLTSEHKLSDYQAHALAHSLSMQATIANYDVLD